MTTEPTCLTCPTYRPDATPRIPHNPPVCDGDRTLLWRHLGDIARLDEELRNDEGPIVDDRQYERFGIRYLNGGEREIVVLSKAWADPLARFGGVAPINSRSKQPSVSGSRERPIPIQVDLHDLKAPARQPNPTLQARDWPEDQIGRLSAATVLDLWVRDIRESMFSDQHLPPATVADLVRWLRDRLEDICDSHPAVDEFAAEMRNLRGALRAAAGETDPPAEPCDGVTCARCNMRALCRRPEDTYRAECTSCGTLYSEAEFTELTAAQAKVERDQRTPEEVHALLRRS